MLGSTYAVVWREGNARARVGKLELAPRHLLLEGAAPRSRPSQRRLPYDALVAVRVGHSAEDRVEGRPTLVLERTAGRAIRISTVDGPGTLHELAERVASAMSID